MYRTVLITVLISDCSGNNDDARKAYFMSLVNALKYSSIVDHRILRYEQSVAYFCSGLEPMVYFAWRVALFI
jgi:hypothetical protein